MKTMGKILAAVMAAVLLCTFSGCFIVEEDGVKPTRENDSSSGAPTSSAESPAEGSSEESSIQPVVFGLNETAVFESQKITVTEWKESAGESIFTPDEGNVFVGVKIIVENISKEGKTFYVSPSQFNAYVDDVAYTDVLFTPDAFDDTVRGTIAPGKKVIGWYAVEAPKDWQKFELYAAEDSYSKNKAAFVFYK